MALLIGLSAFAACSEAPTSRLATPSAVDAPGGTNPRSGAVLLWAGKRDSTISSADIEKFPPRTHGWPLCLRERGCPLTALVLPSCGSALQPMTVHDVLSRAAGLTGKELLIRGPLSQGDASITHNTSEPCQARYTRRLHVGSGSELLLLHSYQSDAFSCFGDETRTCCGLESTSGNVIVRGVLRPGPYLDDPLLCDPGA